MFVVQAAPKFPNQAAYLIVHTSLFFPKIAKQFVPVPSPEGPHEVQQYVCTCI